MKKLLQPEQKDVVMTDEETEAYMDDVYKEINNASVHLRVDGNDLVIRIPYLSGDAEDIINIVKCKHGNTHTEEE